ncbi:hypothetical protein [Bradyrhizobium sp. RT5a]|uniref:sacsin N-terminal ATP-binding-like domain-containing protein n=1 Tax=Bradyrhizobium sp. RT5a TaxID=3156380 RepID=UPI003391D5D7
MPAQSDLKSGQTNSRAVTTLSESAVQDRQIAETTASKIRSFLYELAEGTSNYRSLHSLTEQVEHQYHGRFIVELIQNAHDALPALRHNPGTPARIEVVLKEDDQFGTLYVANDGSPFSPSNFNSLSQLGQSDKDPQVSIGNKGIGFRSVLEIASAPRIHSRSRVGSPHFDGYRFTFSPSDVQNLIDPIFELWGGVDNAASTFGKGPLVDWEVGLLKKFRDKVSASARAERLSPREWLERELSYLSPYLLPFPLDRQDDNATILDFESRGFSTLICLPLKNASALLLARTKIDELADSALLFLERASSVRLDSGTHRRELSREDDPLLATETNGREITITNKEASVEQRYWIWTRDIILRKQDEYVRDAVKQLPGKWPQLEEATVSIGVKLDGAPQPGILSIFLPTLLGTGCATHINAPFFGDMSRTNIDFGADNDGTETSGAGQRYNRFLLLEAARLAISIVQGELAGQKSDAARAVIDLLAPWPTDHGSAQLWQQLINAAANEVGVDLDTAEWFLSDQGWVALNQVSLLPRRESASTLASEMLRKHAAFPTHIRELESRRALIEALSNGRGIDPFPIPDDLASTVESIANELHSLPEADWNGFWSDAGDLFNNDCGILIGKRVLLGNDGQLHAGGAGDCAVFFIPRQGSAYDEEVDSENDIKVVPLSLKPFVAFLSDRIRIYEEKDGRLHQTRVRKLLFDSKLVSTFRREDILKDVLALRTPQLPVSLTDPEAALCQDILLWGLRLMVPLVERGKAEASIEQLRNLPAPCLGGWYPLGQTVFGPGWRDTLGDMVESYLRPVRSAETRQMLRRLLLPPRDERWPLDVTGHLGFFRRAGVFDGLKLTAIEPHSWGSSFQSNKHDFQLPVNSPQGLLDSDWQEYRAFASGKARPSYNFGNYRVQRIYWIPGLERYNEFSEKTRRALMDVIFGSALRWDKGWETLSITRVQGNFDSIELPSPLVHRLSNLPWLGLANGASIDWCRPRERWHVPALELSRGRRWQFSHLRPLPGELAIRLDKDRELASLLHRLGTPLFDPETKSGSTQLLNALVEAVEREEVPNWDVFLGQVRSAWRGFDPNLGTTFPGKLLVQHAGSKLTVETPNKENAIYLPDSAKNFLAALKHFELPVVAIETDEARRLANRFTRAFPQGLILASSLQTVHLADDEPWNKTSEERLRDDPDLEWLIPVLLTIVASYGPQSQGTASRSFRRHLDTLRNARVSVVAKLETSLSHQGTLISSPLSVPALWLNSSNTLLMRDSVKSDIASLSEALSDLLEREDLDVPIKLVLSNAGPRPENTDVLRALEQLKLSEEQYREAREHWRGDLGPIIERLVPLLTIVSPDADTGRLVELDTDEAVAEFLDLLQHPHIDGAALIRMARESTSMFDFGYKTFDKFGELFQLSEWNAALSLCEYPLLKNANAEATFKMHLSTAAQTLRSFIATLQSRKPEIGTFKSLWDRIEGLTCPPHFETDFWDISFNRAMSVAIPIFDQWHATPEELASVRDAWSAENLANRLTGAGVDVGLDPIQLARDNRDKLRQALVRLQAIGLAWALANGSSNPELWEGRVDRYLESLASPIETLAFTHRWGESDIMLLLRRLPVDNSSAALWACVEVASSIDDLIKRLALSEELLLSANAKLVTMREAARQRKRLVQVCGKEFDGSEDNLGGLWEHIRSGLPDAAMGQLSAVDLTHPSALEKSSPPAKRKSWEQKPANKTKHVYLSKSMENLIGLTGEIHAYRMLQTVYGSSVVSASSWISENSLSVYPDNKVSDSRGCDFEIVVLDRTFYIEVKSTEGDGDSFKMGSSEIRLALELAKRRRRAKETFLIMHISNVLTPTPSFRLLPNPYDERNSSLFTIEDADARIRYRPKIK